MWLYLLLVVIGNISVSLSRVLGKDEAVKGKRLLWIISCFNCYLVAIIHGVFFSLDVVKITHTDLGGIRYQVSFI